MAIQRSNDPKLPRGRPIKSRTPLAIFKKYSRLTSAEIARSTGLSISYLDKVSAGFIAPMPLEMAEAISSRFGVDRRWLRGEIKCHKPLEIRASKIDSKGRVSGTKNIYWSVSSLPSGPTLGHEPADNIAALVRTLEVVAKEIDYTLLPPEKEDAESDQAFEYRFSYWKYHIADGFTWYLFDGSDQLPKATTPTMREAARQIAAMEVRWKQEQKKLKKAIREPMEKFFWRTHRAYLAKARMKANSPMLMQEFESLLSDAGAHPQGPLIVRSIVASLHQIRQRFQIARVPGLTQPDPGAEPVERVEPVDA